MKLKCIVPGSLKTGSWRNEKGLFVSEYPRRGDIVEIIGESGDYLVLDKFPGEFDTFDKIHFQQISIMTTRLVEYMNIDSTELSIYPKNKI